MGGASAQIAFEMDSTKSNAKGLYKIKSRFLDGSEIEFNTFVTSFLGFGANEALDHYQDLLIKQINESNIVDPCLPKDYVVSKSSHTFTGLGNFDQCYDSITPLLNKDKECQESNCLFNGVYSPIKDLSLFNFIGVSEFWYTTFEM